MKRTASLDIAKGFAMILVVLGHCYSFSQNNFILYWIYGFHMPFFFLVSGILYGQKADREKGFHLNLCKKIKARLIPYFVFEILFACYLCLAQYLADGLTIDFAVKKFLAIFNFTGLHTTWFLPCLLLVEIIFSMLMKAGKGPCTAVMIGLMLVGLLVPKPSGYQVVLLRCFVACGFFAMGFVAHPWWTQKQHPAIVAVAAVIYGLLAAKNGLVSIVSCTFENAALYVLNSLLGTFVLLQLSMGLHQTCGQMRIISGLAYIGRNSIIVLCTQSFVIEVIRLVDYKLLHSFLPQLGYGEGFVFCTLVMLIEIPTMIIGRKYYPPLFGMQEKRIKNETENHHLP